MRSFGKIKKSIAFTLVVLTACSKGAFASGVTIGSGASVTQTGTAKITTNGDWDNDGTFSAGGGTVELNGDASTVLEAGVSAFNDLIINKTNAADAEITNAINVGANTIIGTTGTIDYTNFDVSTTGSITAEEATATHIFGSAVSLEIPNGATPTVDAAGEIAIDTTDDQLVYFGAAKRVIPYEKTTCATIESLAAADDNIIFFTPSEAITVASAYCVYNGTGTTPATIDLEDGEGNGMTMTDATCADGTSATRPTAQTVSAANNIVARESVAFNVTNSVDPETDTYTICMTYTVDAQ